MHQVGNPSNEYQKHFASNHPNQKAQTSITKNLFCSTHCLSKHGLLRHIQNKYLFRSMIGSSKAITKSISGPSEEHQTFRNKPTHYSISSYQHNVKRTKHLDHQLILSNIPITNNKRGNMRLTKVLHQ